MPGAWDCLCGCRWHVNQTCDAHGCDDYRPRFTERLWGPFTPPQRVAVLAAVAALRAGATPQLVLQMLEAAA